MEKRKPHYDLKKFKKLFKNKSSRRITNISFKGAFEAGYANEDDIITVINKLTMAHFYKSMTSKYSHKIWQDVYEIIDQDEKLYIKLQLSPDEKDAILIQFKKSIKGR